MGKKSLIKSTTKKKSGAKEGEEKAPKNTAAKTPKMAAPKTTKKTAAKKSTKKAEKAKTTKKAAPKKSAAPKKTAAKKTAAPKKTTSKKTTGAKPKAAPKKVSIKDLVFKKFEATQPAPEKLAVPKPTVSKVSAPPLIDNSDPKEVDRIRALLFNKFDMDEIKASAKEPSPPTEQAHEPDLGKASPPMELAEPTIEPEPEKAKSPTDEAYITVEANGTDTGEPMSLPVKIAVAVAATVVFLLLAISYNNGSKYYIHPKDDAIEIWKGRFSPKDDRFFMTLEGVEYTDTVKEVYTKEEVFPLILDYYVDKADTLLEVPGLPDFESIKGHLLQAKTFIVTDEAKTAVNSRLNNIDRMILLYKADVAISKNTEDSLESAIGLLKKAAKLTSSEALSQEITQKIETAREQTAILEAEAKQQEEALEASEEEGEEALKATPEEIKEELKAAPEQDAKK